jgi:Secretion system C-terminal sorting domain
MFSSVFYCLICFKFNSIFRMKKLLHFFCFTILFSACGDTNIFENFPKSTFDSPFPKSNRDLTNILCDTLRVKSGNDTLTLSISAYKNYNLIVDCKSSDTLFKGTVSKYRGLYLFSQQLNDTAYWIYAVKLKDNLIYGLNSALQQTFLIDSAIVKGQHIKLVKYITTESIRLHPNKRELKTLFSSIIETIEPDTILEFNNSSHLLADTSHLVVQIDAEDFDFLSKVYPNPTTDFVNIELQHKSNITYQLSDIYGRIILNGQFTEAKSRIDLTAQGVGAYHLKLVNQKDNQVETIKIVKRN